MELIWAGLRAGAARLGSPPQPVWAQRPQGHLGAPNFKQHIPEPCPDQATQSGEGLGIWINHSPTCKARSVPLGLYLGPLGLGHHLFSEHPKTCNEVPPQKKILP